MQRTAQKRKGRLNKLLTTNIGDYLGGKAFEKASPEFAKIVEEMNDVDERVRQIASGEGEDISPKELLKQAKSNTNRREYMKTAADLGRFHRKMYDIVLVLDSFKKNIDKTHEKFLFHGMDDDTKKHLSTYKGKWASENFQPYLVKEGNILDFFHNLIDERGRALAGWEKRYPGKVKKLRDDTIAILSLSEKMFSILLGNLKLMDKARTIRNPDNYISLSTKIIETFKKYDDGDRGFKKYYSDNIKELLEQQEWYKDKPKAVVQVAPAGQATPVAGPPVAGDITSQISRPVPVGWQNMPPVPVAKPIPGPGQQLEEKIDPETGQVTYIDQKSRQEVPAMDVTMKEHPKFDPSKRQEMTAPKMRISTHAKFYESLEAMSEESSVLIASHIKKYAKLINDRDPETAIRLLKVALLIEE